MAKSKSAAILVYRFWKVQNQIGAKGIAVTMHPENHMLNIHKYKEELWTCVKPLLEVYGLDKNETEKLKSEIVK